MSRPQRRGSHSSNMLKPSVTIVQSQHNADGSVRRRSLPHHLMMGGISSQNGTSVAPQQQQQQSGYAPQSQHLQQPQQQHSIAQVRSVTSSMDLISSSSLSGAPFPPPQEKYLFKSSSHHTSHTAAAGDLLSMSRRAFAPPTNHQTSVGGKKRSSTISEDPGNDVNMDGMSCVGPQNNTNTQQNIQTHVSVTPSDTSTLYSNGFNSTATTKLCNTVSTSTFASQGVADESYQQHRTIRRCQRSDSFEMMEDG
mmetsp:Transcript_33233/g.67768  ORF Transcript_33233/g.67768 Transcript_33233/m.67768 type:complete len:252 (+) Transcript_33233:118-873(+)